MKRLIAFISAIVGFGGAPDGHTHPLDYDKLVWLDAEALAETGVREAYERLLPSLTKYVSKPVKVEEIIDSNAPSYAITAGGIRYEIYSPKTSQEQSWANATYALFDIVNRQLVTMPYKLYAINGGNDLGGMFLTNDQYKAAVASLKKKTDWPYIPNQKAPWFGQPH